MRVIIHFPFKPSVLITKCEFAIVTSRTECVVNTSEASEWDMLLGQLSVSAEGDPKQQILSLYKDGTCLIEQTEENYYKITGMSAIEVSDREFNN